MKWWQLTWLLNEDLDFLQNVLAEPEWAEYRQWLAKDEALIKAQRRDILDAIVPDELALNALQGCPWLYKVANRQLKGGYRDRHLLAAPCMLTALEAYRKYGADALVEAVEKGSAAIG
jgi:hypothetical protein